jgi:hypothetical protein
MAAQTGPEPAGPAPEPGRGFAADAAGVPAGADPRRRREPPARALPASLDGERLELRSVVPPPTEPAGDVPVRPGAGSAVVDAAGGVDALVEASGMPPEVAAFLAESATAAGVELGSALRAAGVRSRRRSRTSPDRVQRSFYLSRDLVDRARAAVSATMDTPGEAYNVSQLAGRALENEVLRLERIYNGGQRFPPVTHVPSGPSPEGVERIRAGVTSPRRRRNAR